MITYELKCKKCQEKTVITQSILKDLPKVCEKCGGDLTQNFGTKNEHLYFTEYRGARAQRFR